MFFMKRSRKGRRLCGGRWPFRLLSLVALALFFPPSPVGRAAAEPMDETVRILEQWTAAHWGQDCYVWVLYYSDELIEPWVASEARRTGMTAEQQEAYRGAFVSDLRLESSETFLVSVYSFGIQPVNLAPLSEHIALVTASGERLRPTRYDSSLDSPTGGVVQGLVFFPKQADPNFVLAIKGMGPGEERVFSFEAAPRQYVPLLPEPESEPELVVVELPKQNKSVRKATVPKPAAEGPKVIKSDETIPPPPPPAPRFIPPLLAEDSRDMAEFVNSVRDRSAPASADTSPPVGGAPAQGRQVNVESSYVSREQVLRQFLALWADNRAGEMYAMLADPSRRSISQENFAKEVARASGFRAGLKDEYRIEWLGEERAKVITAQRVVMIRSLLTRTLGIVREGTSWKIVW